MSDGEEREKGRKGGEKLRRKALNTFEKKKTFFHVNNPFRFLKGGKIPSPPLFSPHQFDNFINEINFRFYFFFLEKLDPRKNKTDKNDDAIMEDKEIKDDLDDIMSKIEKLLKNLFSLLLYFRPFFKTCRYYYYYYYYIPL